MAEGKVVHEGESPHEIDYKSHCRPEGHWNKNKCKHTDWETMVTKSLWPNMKAN